MLTVMKFSIIETARNGDFSTFSSLTNSSDKEINMALSKVTRQKQIRGNDLARFWSKVQKTNGCWLWTGGQTEDGYGVFYIGKKNVWAHRYSFFLAYERWPFPIARHVCDNPSCVRPDHIVAGTQLDNIRDREERGRTARRQGEDHAQVKLTKADVLEIRRLSSLGRTGRSIAKQYNISASHVSCIRLGRVWRHLELPALETPSIEWVCAHCGERHVQPSRFRHIDRQFCSPKCHYAFARAQTPQWRCQQCGKVFIKARGSGGVRKFCSEACHYTYGRKCSTYEQVCSEQ